MKIKNISTFIWLAACATFLSNETKAQLSVPTSMYFQNEYIFNPSVAGKTPGLNVGLSYMQNVTSGNGNTVGNIVTLDYGKGKNGFGLFINTDKDGVMNVNKFGASYAYHLKAADNGVLSFGLTAGVSGMNINLSDIVGDVDDALVRYYNDQNYNFDADLGVHYQLNKLSVSAVASNLRGLIDSKLYGGFNYNKFYASASYQLVDGAVKVTPKVLYRGLHEFDDVIDAGLNLQFSGDKVSFQTFYHSNNSVSAGLGFEILERYNVQANYVLPISNELKHYTNGAFEIGIRANLKRK